MTSGIDIDIFLYLIPANGKWGVFAANTSILTDKKGDIFKFLISYNEGCKTKRL